MTAQRVPLWRGLLRADYSAAVYRLVRFNACVTAHELRMRMRGYRLFWVLFSYAAVAAAAFLITLWIAAWQEEVHRGAPGMLEPGLGRIVLTVISYVQLALILLILPAYSAGAVTMEREKRTLEMLRATLLSASDVVTGKWLVVLALGAVLLLSSLPVAAWCLALGGVAPEDLLYVYTYLFATAAFASAVGLFLSTALGRSLGAIVWTYAVLIVVSVGPFIGLAIAAAGRAQQGNPMTLAFGRIWSWMLLGVIVPACAWLLFLVVRWPWRRLFSRRWARLGSVLGAVAAAALLYWAFRPAGPLVGPVARLPILWILAGDPFVVLAGLLAGEGALSQMISAMTMPRLTLSLQTVLWLSGTGCAIVGAAFLWAVAIRTYGARK